MNEIKKHIIALEVAALERWNNGDPSGYIEIFAEDISYFDPYTEKRIDGIAALTALYEGIRGQIHVDSYEMIAPEVTVSGDMAVLTYNLNSWVEPLRKTFKWNCTEVYRHEEKGWKIVHNHWSLVRPLQ
jgi:ketosteroid isomerase-like protein